MNSSTSQLSGFVFGQQGYDIFGNLTAIVFQI